MASSNTIAVSQLDKFQKAKVTWLNYCSLGWLTPLIIQGAKAPLKAEQLYQVPEGCKAEKLADFLTPFWRNRVAASSLFVREFGPVVLLSVILHAGHIAFKLILPGVVKELLIFLSQSNSNVQSGLQYAFMLFGFQLGSIIFRNLSVNLMIPIQLKLRTILLGAIYEKSLRLSQYSSYEFSKGQILNMVNVDAENVVKALGQLALFLCAPFHFGISLMLIYFEIGNAMWAGCGILIGAFSAMALCLHSFLVPFELGFLKCGDERLKHIREMLYGIKVIKFRSLETFFLDRISFFRTKQLSFLQKCYLIEFCNEILVLASLIGTPVVSLLLYGSNENGIISDEVFPALIIFGGLFGTLLILSAGYKSLLVGSVSWKRIFKFLQAEEEDSAVSTLPSKLPKGCILFEDASFKWLQSQKGKDGEQGHRGSQSHETLPLAPSYNYFTLDSISVQVQTGCKVGIVGAVGSGKSSLISALIGQMEATGGTFGFNGTLSYCSQQPWILTDTVRGNIVFNNTEDRHRLDRVIKACELEKDLCELPCGEQTQLGEKGVNLSGGQKARLALARALYQDNDIYLLDDPLSALDANVGRKVFDNAIMKYLVHKTVLLITHQLHVLHELDYIIVMDKGRILEQGPYDYLLAKGGMLFELMKRYAIDKSKVVLEPTEAPKKALGTEEGIITKEDQEQGAVKSKIFWAYIQACGGWLFVIFIVCVLLARSGFNIMSHLWLTWWSEGREYIFGVFLPKNTPETSAFYLKWYGVLGILTFLSMLGLFAAILAGSYRAAKVAHVQALLGLLNAPISFFESQPMGRILNRLSKDVQSLDQSMWTIVYLTLIGTGDVVANTFVLIAIVDWRMCLLLVPLLVIYIAMVVLYQRSNRELKRHESTFKSPLYAHISETLSGISTIKAYNVADAFVKKKQRLINESNCPTFLKESVNVWINLRMEVLSTAVVLLLALLGIFKAISPSLMGLALFYGLGFSAGLTFLLLWVSRLEAELNSVERLETYRNELPQEASRHNQNDPDFDSWPQRGHVEFEAINVSYPSNANEKVLKNVTFEIRGGEKVGLVGRTGSGKSTLALALFRILELQEGCIKIDGIDISTLGLDTLRKRLQIIPQDPILFYGTIQSNLDLECKYSDNDLWDVLEMVGLKDYVSQQSGKLGCVVEESGANLSVGQRQLICLARAILTKPKILVMDEATASIDNEADKIIQRSIRSHLQNTTILCIAHRLNTIADFDRILVLNEGVVEEFDTPIALLGSNGIFSQLVNATGPANAQLIREIAKLTREQDKVLC